MAGNGSNGFDLISAGIGGLSNIVSGLLTNWQNRKMQAEQNAFNREEREFAQQFQDEQRTAQNDWSERMYNDYQSPQAMVKAYSDAGLNPRLAVGNTSSPGVSSGSSGSGIMASPTAPPYLNSNAYSLPFGEIAQGLANLAQAKKLGIDSKWADQLYENQIKGMVLENEAKEFMNSINFKFVPKKMKKELEQLCVNIAQGTASVEEIHKKISILETEGAIQKHVLDHWEETYKANSENLQADTENKRAQTKTEGSKQENYKASTNQLYALADNLRQEYNIRLPNEIISNVISAIEDYSIAHPFDKNSPISFEDMINIGKDIVYNSGFDLQDRLNAIKHLREDEDIRHEANDNQKRHNENALLMNILTIVLLAMGRAK